MRLLNSETLNMNPYIYAGLFNIESSPIKSSVRANTIIDIVCSYFDKDTKHVKGKSRKEIYTIPRHFCRYYCHKYTNLTLVEIGSYFNSDHATGLHSKKVILNWIDPKCKDKEMIANNTILTRLIENALIFVNVNL